MSHSPQSQFTQSRRVSSQTDHSSLRTRQHFVHVKHQLAETLHDDLMDCLGGNETFQRAAVHPTHHKNLLDEEQKSKSVPLKKKVMSFILGGRTDSADFSCSGGN